VVAGNKVDKLDYASRWMRDGLHAVSTKAGFFLCAHVDVGAIQNVMDAYQRGGRRITYTHVAIKVCADLLARNEAHHKFVANNKTLHPDTVDIGLSVAADQPLAPVLVIKAADRKSLVAISEEVERRAPEVRGEFAKTISQWKKWGWLVPFSFLRRPLLRMVAGGLNARRKAAGTFQITNLPNVDIFVPLLLGGVSALGMGRVSERVVPHQGKIVIRPMITLGYSVDHAVFDGRAAANFLSDLKAAFESCDSLLDSPPVPVKENTPESNS
jgi:pyruvate dehydrogenase E2 component (dihydrolipoamide acetyltransferase)